MGQSLASAAVSGTKSTLSDEKRELLDAGDIEGLIALNRRSFGGWSMKVGDDDADDGDDDGDDGDDDDQDDDDDEDDEDEDDDKPSKLKSANRRIQELSAESAKHRKRASARGRRITELETEIAELKKGKAKPKPKDDEEDGDEPDDSEARKLKADNEKLQERLVTQQLRTEFSDLTTGNKPLAKFIDPKAAFRLLDLDEVEIDEDGDIIGLDEAIKDLAKSKPYLLDKGKDREDDEDDDDEDDDRPRRRRTGQPPARRKDRKTANRDKLVSKYPALRR